MTEKYLEVHSDDHSVVVVIDGKRRGRLMPGFKFLGQSTAVEFARCAKQPGKDFIKISGRAVVSQTRNGCILTLRVYSGGFVANLIKGLGRQYDLLDHRLLVWGGWASPT